MHTGAAEHFDAAIRQPRCIEGPFTDLQPVDADLILYQAKHLFGETGASG